jgi:hypothetical protein
MADETTFDIINVNSRSEMKARVLARGIRAENRTFALLRFVRDQFGIAPDVLSMYDGEYESPEPCGCVTRVSFGKVKAKRLHGFITGERTPTHAEIFRDGCNEHGSSVARWEGYVEAWAHKPKRPDVFEI